MIINQQSIESLFKGYSASFKQGFSGAETQYKKVAMVVPSSTRENLYAWLGQFPKVREWIGDRLIQNLSAHGYTVINRSFENTISVKRDDIEDDQFGVYGPMMQEMGKAVAELPDELIFGLIKEGFFSKCYDGQYFFDTDHPVIAEYLEPVFDANNAPVNGPDGQQRTIKKVGTVSISNMQAGSGPAWYMLDTSRAMKPFLYQERRAFEFTALNRNSDENVFFKKEYIYGTDGRCNAAYGFWQLAYASRQPLNAANYSAIRKQMMGLKGDALRLLGIRPNILVVPPELEEAGLKLLNSEHGPAGETNPWKGTAELLVTPWIA